MGYNWAKIIMEKFKLSNLRELSTEEQLRLNGGANSEGCSCKCSCSCNCGPGVYSAGYAGGEAALDGVKEQTNQKRS